MENLEPLGGNLASGGGAAVDPRVRPAGPSSRTRQLPVSTIVIYSLPSLVLGVSSSLVILYLLKFATDVMLIAPGLFASVFAMARIWDAVSDPVVGYLSDGTTSKYGRRRPWITLGAIPLAVATVMLWSPPASLTGALPVLWVSVAAALFYTTYTTIAVPHLALGAEMTDDFHDRSRVFAGRGIFDFVGTLIAALAIWWFQATDDPRFAVQAVAWGVAVLSVPLLWFSMSRITERPEYQGRGAHAPARAFKDVMKNHHARLLIAIFFLENLSIAFITTLFPFSMQYMMPGDTRDSGPFLAIAMLITVISFPMWLPISRRFGKRNTWLVANVMKLIAFVSLFFLSPEREWPGLVTIIFIGASLSAHVILAPSIKADVVDYDEYTTGERKEGSYFAIWNLVLKIAGACAVAISGLMLEVSGYEANVQQSADTLFVMRAVFAGLPATLHVVVIVLLLRFSLNEREHAEIRRAIDARNSST